MSDLTRSVVHFRTTTGDYAADVDHVREVRTTAGMLPLPAPKEGVGGLLPGDTHALTVLTVLGPSGDQVLVLQADEAPFGLLVDAVLRVIAVREESIEGPPSGQAAAVVSGVIRTADGLILLVDVNALAGLLAR